MILEPDTFKIRMRPFRGTYEESMKNACYVSDAEDVLAYIHCFYPQMRPAMKEIAQRYFGSDPRNGWSCWLVSLRSTPVLTDKEVPDIQLLQPLSTLASSDTPSS